MFKQIKPILFVGCCAAFFCAKSFALPLLFAKAEEGFSDNRDMDITATFSSYVLNTNEPQRVPAVPSGYPMPGWARCSLSPSRANDFEYKLMQGDGKIKGIVVDSAHPEGNFSVTAGEIVCLYANKKSVVSVTNKTEGTVTVNCTQVKSC